MKKEDLYELLSDIDEDAVKAAETPPVRKPKLVWIKYAVPAAACIALIVGIAAINNYSDTDIYTDVTSLYDIGTYTSPSVSTETFTAPASQSEADTASSASETYTGTSAPLETVSAVTTHTETVTVPSELTETVTVPTKPTETATVPSRPTETAPEFAETITAASYPPLTLENYISDDNLAVLAKAKYPEMPKYGSDEAYEFRKEMRSLPQNYIDGFNKFFINSSRIFLSGSVNENKLYSPLSLYLALGMTAEITDGSSRQQILDVLSEESIGSMRLDARSIWQHNYSDNGMAKCIFATSLWKNNEISYNKDTVDLLAENYYSSVFTGNPASYEYNKMLQDWINEQTDGMLKGQIPEEIMSPFTVFELVSTVNYNGTWYSEFSAEMTKPDIFHSHAGDIECDFMNKEYYTEYFWGDNFSAIELMIEENGAMRFILPDEGVSPEELLNDDEVISFMTDSTYYYKNSKYLVVDMSIPKFDISADIDFRNGLEKMGISDIFDIETANFSPFTEDTDVFISSAKQSLRAMIDENGCKASSMTIISGAGAGAPELYEYVDFILDRPFLFEIYSSNGTPLFIGIVNKP